jgi:CRP/FNR family transcriptional regulator, cyclic AMP receptor protein
MQDTWISYAIYAVAYAASIAAFAFNSMALLRMFTIISSSLYVIYYYAIISEPLWLDILSEGALVLINGVMLVILAIKQRKVQFTVEEKEIYQGVFSRLSPFEFFKLMKAGQWRSHKPGDILTRKGENVDSIYFIYNGEAAVQLPEEKEVRLLDGSFVGEMSFSLSKPAVANVEVVTPTRVVCWKQEELRAFLKRNPAMKNHFNSILTEDLAKKLSN